MGENAIVYEIILPAGFITSQRKALRKEKNLEKHITKALDSLIQDPYYTTRLIVRAKGLRRIKLGGLPWRLIFCIVEECKRNQNEKQNLCEKFDGKTVIAWLIYQRKGDYKNIRSKTGFFN